MKSKASPAVIILFLFIIFSGCSRRIVLGGESSMVKKGEDLFSQNCNRCHPDGMKGKGPALFSKKLPVAVIRFQVRNGLGAMPSFSKQELPKSDLDNIVVYIKQKEAEFRAK